MKRALKKWCGMVWGVGTVALAAEPAQVPDTASVFQQRVELAESLAVSPDGTDFAFSWRGDVWIVSTTGGVARAVASHPAQDTQPVFSPDGRELAFVSRREDASQIFTVPIQGGVPTQRTFCTEGAALKEYTPDGSNLVYCASRDATGLMSARMYETPRFHRGPERMIGDDYAWDGTLSPDGKFSLLVREGLESFRQGYRGSGAAQIWLYDRGQNTWKKMMERSTNCANPMWRPDGKAFYYLDSRSGVANLWEREVESGHERPLTAFSNSPIRDAAISRDGSTIVFQQMFEFYRLNPTATPATPARIEVVSLADSPGDRSEWRRWYDKLWNGSDYGTLDATADGLEMVFTGGGDVWVMDTVLREPRPVTTGTADHDSEARFAPDGSAIYFLRDTGDAVNLWSAKRKKPDQYWWQGALFGLWSKKEDSQQRAWWQNESFDLQRLTDDRKTRSLLRVSPDGLKLSWVEGRGSVCVYDLKSRETQGVAEAPVCTEIQWSPDSRWLACSLHDSGDNQDVWIVSATGSRAPYNLSRNPSWDGNPRWSPDGRFLAYVGRMYDGPNDVYYVWLGRDEEERSRRDRSMEKALEAMDASRRNGAARGGSAGASPAKPASTVEKGPIRIDFDGLAERLRTVKVDSLGGIYGWSPDGTRMILHLSGGAKTGTYKLAFPPFEAALEKISPHVGREVRILPGSTLFWMVDGVPCNGDTKLPFALYQTVDDNAYRRLAFRLIWREMRDSFYDERLNNLNWDDMLKKYEDAAARAVDDASFARVVYMLLGELNASHMGYTPSKQNLAVQNGNWRIDTAHLGLWFDPDWQGPGWKVKGVVRGGPADMLKSKIAPGEILRSINGVPLRPEMDPTEVLNGRLPREFQVEVDDTRGRTRTVVLGGITYGAARDLIRDQTIAERRETVSSLSTNTIGYLSIEAMNWPSLRQFEKEIFAEGVGKDGMIIDVRNNGGGFISDFLLAILCHPHHAITVPRGGAPGYPSGYLGKVIWTKPIVVLCNQNSASNAEIFTHAIKALGRGRVVGVPTCGAVISTPSKEILDVGTLRVPDRGWFSIVDGADMELHGVVPDIYVWPKPGDMPAGKDVQLERAVDAMQLAIAEEASRPKPPLLRASERPVGTAD